MQKKNPAILHLSRELKPILQNRKDLGCLILCQSRVFEESHSIFFLPDFVKNGQRQTHQHTTQDGPLAIFCNQHFETTPRQLFMKSSNPSITRRVPSKQGN